MLTLDSYKKILSKQGRNLAEKSRKDADRIAEATFTADPYYKQAYILTKDGWKYEDIKYQKHTNPSILKDAADYYVQFRPKVHYPIGSYIIIPEEEVFDNNLSEHELENPFLQPVENRTQWWLIVGRDSGNFATRYSVLKCNWNFKWIYNGKVQECFACVRNANSYTSGAWSADYTVTLDNLTASWLPDTYHVYGDKLQELGLYDTRTVHYNQRFMITNNTIHPKCYTVTKVTEMTPQGILKLAIKQDDYNENRDNVDEMICDYYKDEGTIKKEILPNIDSIEDKNSSIFQMILDENGMLTNDTSDIQNNGTPLLFIGQPSYFQAQFSDNASVNAQWKIELINDNNYSDEELDYYQNLITITKFDDQTIALKPGKANSLNGKHFLLSVSDGNGNYYSSIELAVIRQ